MVPHLDRSCHAGLPEGHPLVTENFVIKRSQWFNGKMVADNFILGIIQMAL